MSRNPKNLFKYVALHECHLYLWMHNVRETRKYLDKAKQFTDPGSKKLYLGIARDCAKIARDRLSEYFRESRAHRDTYKYLKHTI